MAITLDDINMTLKEQNKSLDLTARSLVKFLEGERSSKGDDLEEKIKARRVKSSPSNKAPSGLVSGFKAGAMEASGLSMMSRWVSGALSGAFGGATLATVAGLAGKFLGRGAVWGTAAALIGTFGSDLINKIFTDLDPKDVVLGGDDKKLLAVSLGDALRNGAIGMIFGKKLGIAAFFGSLLSDSIKSMFPSDMKWEDKQKMFGLEMPFTKENFLDYGSIIAAFFGPSLIRGAIGAALGFGAAGGGPKGAAAGAAPKAGFLKGFKPTGFKGLGWAGMLMFTGGLLADWVGEQTGSQGAADLLKVAITAGSLALMFGTGPLGILAATVGLAIHGGILIKEHHDRKLKGMREAFEKEVAVEEAKLAAKKITPDAAILMAVDRAKAAGARNSSGTVTTDEQAAADEAILRRVEKNNPDKVAQIYLQEEIAYLKGEYDNQRMLTPGNGGLWTGQLITKLQEMEQITGKPSPLLAQLISDSNNLYTQPEKRPGMNTAPDGGGLSLGVKPQRESFTAWWRKEVKEDRMMRHAMRDYNRQLEDLMPPPSLANGGGGLTIGQVINNSGSSGGSQRAITPSSGMGSTSDTNNKLHEALTVQ
mgnify:CR=1 FL=1